MDPNPTPWRVLEDPVDAGAGQPEPAAANGPFRIREIRRATLLAAGSAALLAIGAFVLAFGSGSSGTVAIEGGRPLGSQAPAPSAARTLAGASGAGASGAAATGRLLVVEIVGAVGHPGVFRMPADARVGDLVAAAGGYGPRVDAERAGRDLNLAAALHDGDQVRVPSRDDPAVTGTARPGGTAGSTSTRTSKPPAGPIDLNRATAAELDALPGIGPVTAAKIIAAREEQPFVAVEDLRTRKLIGQKTFDALKDLVAVH